MYVCEAGLQIFSVCGNHLLGCRCFHQSLWFCGKLRQEILRETLASFSSQLHTCSAPQLWHVLFSQAHGA